MQYIQYIQHKYKHKYKCKYKYIYANTRGHVCAHVARLLCMYVFVCELISTYVCLKREHALSWAHHYAWISVCVQLHGAYAGTSSFPDLCMHVRMHVCIYAYYMCILICLPRNMFVYFRPCMCIHLGASI